MIARRLLPWLCFGVIGAAPLPVWAAPPAGPHPRIALTAPVLSALKARAKVSGSGAARAIAACEAASVSPGQPDGYQGDGWAFNASACALAFQLTQNHAYAARGVALLRALLEDVRQIGDRKACVVGAPPEQAIASIKRDTGYAIRFIGPHAALAYDWLHDAPEMGSALLQQSRACFSAWIDWYTRQGYLRAQPGANYHAGFVLAKTLIAIATSGEGGSNDAGTRFWRDVVDDVFGTQIVANGLAGDNGGVPRRDHHGVLVGGDWPEGWQYGLLSVVEYALAARALEEQGASWPAIHGWVDDLVLRFVHGLTPTGDEMYVGGDVDNDRPNLEVDPSPLVAALLGPSGARAAGWAAALRQRPALRRPGVPVFDALAEVRPAAASDPYTSGLTPFFLARGTRNLYVRSDWTRDAFWSVLTSPPRQVDDHQHLDASGFVFSRGGDPLVVDPTPYGSRSSLTGNALTVDSDVVGPKYRPSQTPWGSAELLWARATKSGVVAARADIAGTFAYGDLPSDIALARRDWVFLPQGEIVVVDRARTASRDHRIHIRFRSLAPLALAGNLARGTTGKSAIAIHAVALSPAARPAVRAIAAGGECTEEGTGSCTLARFAVGQYAVDVAGPEPLAIHVIDGLAAGEAPALTTSITDLAIDPAGDANRGVAGARIVRAGRTTFVVAAARARDEPSALGYLVPAADATRHVVFDAPEDRQGRAAVTAVPVGEGRCRIELRAAGSGTQGVAMTGRPVIFALAPASGGCAVTEDPGLVANGLPLTGGGAAAAPPAGRSGASADWWRRGKHILRRLPYKRHLLAGAALVALIATLALIVGRGRRRPARADR